MPPLKRPTYCAEKVLTQRFARVISETDVLVVGGGPAGLGAAIGAAQAGARVVLAERLGFLGGNATAALVIPMVSFFTQEPVAERAGSATLFPTDHGQGQAVISGVLANLIERLVGVGGAIPPSPETGYVVPFDPEIFKLVAFELLDEAGVEFLLHAFANEVVGSDRVEGVVFETKCGPVVIKARAIVDCTGDGDVAARAGAPYEVGRESDGLTEPLTLMFVMAGIDQRDFAAYVDEHPNQWYGVHGLWDLIDRARVNGDLNLQREDILFFGTTRSGEVSVNSTRIAKVNGIDVWDLSYAEWEGRRQMREIANFMRRYVPGFEKAYVAQSGVNVGVRETRKILGEYKMTAKDVLEARKFADVVARGSYPMDIHNPEGKGTFMGRLPPGEAYDIPLRALLPLDVEGLAVGGRCISGTHEAQSSYRAMPICMATGQAAGVCAAIAARTGVTPRGVNVTVVQEELVRQGADLGGVG